MKWYFLLPITVVLFLFNPTDNYLSDKPKINFVNDDKLMWLVDVDIGWYSMFTKEEYPKEYKDYWKENEKYQCGMEIGGDEASSSYECYLEKVNNNPAYKYSNWRLPTTKELLGLEIARPSLMRWFISEKTADNVRAIDTDVFYDGKLSSFSSDIVKPTDYGYEFSKSKQVYAVYYGYRYPGKTTWSWNFAKGSGGSGGFHSRRAGARVIREVAFTDLPIRLVRDREPSKYWASRVWRAITYLFALLTIGFLLYKAPNMWRAIKQWWRDTFLPTPDEKVEK